MGALLLELYSEEIPSWMQEPAAVQLRKAFSTKLQEAHLAVEHVEAHVTPRRLTLWAEGIPEAQKDVTEELKGPRIDAPKQAIEGFMRSNGLKESELVQRELKNGVFYFATKQQKGQPSGQLLTALIAGILQDFKWPKSMRWSSHQIRWVRPLQNICCIWNGKTLPVQFGHLTANNKTFGHPFLSPVWQEVSSIDEYKSFLSGHSVVLDRNERMALISKEADKLAKQHQVAVLPDQGLLEEVTGLVEYPVPIMGHIEHKFMKLPDEALSTSMRTHQKYFSVTQEGGKLAPFFITVANQKHKDKAALVIAGNERVLKARLSDAAFFWEQDQKTPLEGRLERLDQIVFHARLGSVKEKVQRISALAKLFSVWIPHANLLLVERAAELCKTDLLTGMVGEFPELQGVMGRYYAINDGEELEVAEAVKDHYHPLGPNDYCPTAPISVAIALADKIDTLVGLFSIDEKPTGSKDPFALRRAALGVIRIILENNLNIPLKLLIEKALLQYPAKIFRQEGEGKLAAIAHAIKHDDESVGVRKKKVTGELLEFFIERLRNFLKDRDVGADLIHAVFNGGNEDDLCRIVARIAAVEQFLATEDGQNVFAAYRRATNIVRIEEKKDDVEYDGNVAAALLKQPEEKALAEALKSVTPLVAKAIKVDKFEQAMQHIASLRKPVDAFFEAVVVNDEQANLRENRLKLLSQIRGLLHEIADFSKIERS